MRILTTILGLVFLTCASTGVHTKAGLDQGSEAEAAVKFINSYIQFLNERNAELSTAEWIKTQATVTDNFKTKLSQYITEHEFLNFDPILDAQDYPIKGFELDRVDSEHVIVKGINWPNFRLTLRVTQQNGKCLIDGSGVINIPEDKRIER